VSKDPVTLEYGRQKPPSRDWLIDAVWITALLLLGLEVLATSDASSVNWAACYFLVGGPLGVLTLSQSIHFVCRAQTRTPKAWLGLALSALWLGYVPLVILWRSR